MRLITITIGEGLDGLPITGLPDPGDEIIIALDGGPDQIAEVVAVGLAANPVTLTLAIADER
jgi:hypothetical protein